MRERDTTPVPPSGPDPFRSWLEGARLWNEGAFGARRVLTKAARRSSEDTRAVLDAASAANGTPDLATLARLGDLSRAQWFLWTGAGLAAGERAGRATSAKGYLPGAYSPRALVLGMVASDLYLGYVALRERARWFPDLVTDEDWKLQHRRGAGRALDAAEALGGTLIKAGQFASSRPDLLPAAYTETLSSLQDRVPPQPFAVIEEAVVRELGRPIAEVFEEFDEEPIAAASIAQVHRARLRGDREVAVKVQYPGIAGLIEADLDALESIFEAVARLEPGIRLKPIADYLRWTLPLELDFRREARSIGELGDALADRDDVIVPGVVGGISTGRLLVMELVRGVKITDTDALVAAEIDPGEVATLLNDVYADQLFKRGILHADPHPGNLLVQPGPRLVLLDHGLTLPLERSFISALEKMVSALGEGDLDALIPALREAGLPVSEDTDLDTLLQVVGVLLGGEREETSASFEDFGRRLGASVGDIPPKLLLVGRAIGLLDGITRQLDPEADALEIVARYTGNP
ncbi:MAG TPA: AarF/UbiB family protein [Rubrobacteraceae bacterium]|nr:AarF/UbiB family protein [Rubrobacteraceae bacterium]